MQVSLFLSVCICVCIFICMSVSVCVYVSVCMCMYMCVLNEIMLLWILFPARTINSNPGISHENLVQVVG